MSTEIFIILDLKIKIEKGILCSINFYFSTSINISHAKNNKNNNKKKHPKPCVYTHGSKVIDIRVIIPSHSANRIFVVIT